MPRQSDLRLVGPAGRAGRLQGTECRADQAVAGDHREAGIPAGEQGLGRQAEQTRAAGTLAAATGFEARKVKVFRAFLWSQPYAMGRSEEHTSELQSLMRISYAVFCLKQKQQQM